MTTKDRTDPEKRIVRFDAKARVGSSILAISLRSHPGLQRAENQDRVGHFRVPLGEIILVADGVGGQADGAKAASIAVAEFGRVLLSMPVTREPADALAEATSSVGSMLRQLDTADGEQAGMASTIVLALVHQDTAYIGHIGDSRAYVMRDGLLDRLTLDHSFVQEMVAHGVLSEEKMQSHPKAHVLTRSFGQPDAALEISTHPLRDGDVLMLCSDGLWAYVAQGEIESALSQMPLQASAATKALESLALDAGAPDNVSVAVLTLSSAPAKQDKEATRRTLTRPRTLLFVLCAVLLLLAAAAVLLFRSRH